MVTIPSSMLLADAARILVKQCVGSAPVVDAAHTPIGELSRQACTDALLDSVYEGVPTDPVADYALRWETRVTDSASMVEMVSRFRSVPQQRLLPVFRNEKFVGIVTRSALIRAFLDLLETMPDHDSRLLYLSALREWDEAPGL
jgi:CBS domain-containing protein